jgi:hypothetical protein
VLVFLVSAFKLKNTRVLYFFTAFFVTDSFLETFFPLYNAVGSDVSASGSLLLIARVGVFSSDRRKDSRGYVPLGAKWGIWPIDCYFTGGFMIAERMLIFTGTPMEVQQGYNKFLDDNRDLDGFSIIDVQALPRNVYMGDRGVSDVCIIVRYEMSTQEMNECAGG